jgi:poly(3-hydroxybutyrate) depolymerase
LADQHGFVVVYPDGYKHTWNDCHSQATFAAHTENIDDMGFVKGLIAREGYLYRVTSLSSEAVRQEQRRQ